MTERELRAKVAKGLECCAIDGGCSGCPYDSFKDCPGSHPIPETLMRDVLALLKAQEPMKPLKMAVDHVRKEPVVFSYECPVCMCGLQRHWVACPICGTGVKWE